MYPRKSTYSISAQCVEVEAEFFRKSSFSTYNGNCTEVSFRTSSYTDGGAANCVEAGDTGTVIIVRDTKQDGHPDRTVLEFSTPAWREAMRRIKAGSLG